jgi:hypothetical protein
LASMSSMASSGQTPTQQPQKSHFPGTMCIINGVVRRKETSSKIVLMYFKGQNEIPSGNY